MKKPAKKILLIILCVLLVLALTGVGTVGYLYYADSRDNAETVRLSAVATGEKLVEGNTLSYVLSNDGYCPVQLRQILILSRFDREGNPVPAGGSAYSSSDVELVANEALTGKVVQKHQVLYITEDSLQAGKTLFADFFSPREETNCQQTLSYELQIPDEGIVRVDVIVQGKTHADDPWQTALTLSDTVGSGSGQSAVVALPAEIPELVNPVSYRWELADGKARLSGLGSIPEKEILIPAEVPLSQVDERYIYDPINGTLYPVELGTYALAATDIRQVTFLDGVTTQVSMGQNVVVFTSCSSLTAVYNIPDDVTSMNYTFSGCTSLQVAPELPEGVVYMQGTFTNCIQLTQMPVLPEGVVTLTSCFKGCTGLTHVADLPDSVTDMSECFKNCTNLKTVEELPAAARNMSYCFENCVNLLSVPKLPQHCEMLTYAFSGCSSLGGTVEIPAAVDLSQATNGTLTLWNTFANCRNLDGIIIPCCENADLLYSLPSNVPVETTMEHLSEGSCPGCFCTTGTFVIDGLTVYFDHPLSTTVAETLMDFIDNELPDEIKDACVKLTVTEDLVKYNFYRKANGFARFPFCTAYVKMTDTLITTISKKGLPRYLGVTAHELGHCYDCSHGWLSNSSRWKQLSSEEGDFFTNVHSSGYYMYYEYNREYFANAVDLYYSNPESLQKNCPKMYEYIDELFGEAETAENSDLAGS